MEAQANEQSNEGLDRKRTPRAQRHLALICAFLDLAITLDCTRCDHFGIQEKAAVHGCCSKLPSLQANNLDVLLDGVDPLGVRVLPISSAKSR